MYIRQTAPGLGAANTMFSVPELDDFRSCVTTIGPSATLAGAAPVLRAAAVLIGATVVASLMPATRASRVDVLRALRSE